MRSLPVSSFILAGALSVSCGGDSPTTPTAPDIVLISNQPSSGATIALGCAAPTGFICTDDLALAFDVRFDRSVQDAWLNVEFVTSTGQVCAGAVDYLAVLQPGVEVRATTGATLLSSVPDVAVPRCPLPVTTTRIVATLVDGSAAPDARLLTREFAATYTFAAP